jgi:PAS domain S-box-containing protein
MNMLGIEELSDLFQQMPIALYRTTPNGELLAGNMALARLLGYETVEDARKALESVETAYVGPEERARWLEAITTSGVVHDFDVELIRPDGTTVWVQNTGRTVTAASGELRYFEGALIDVTENVRAKKAKDEFVATVSHELRNPIAVVLGLSEELAKDYDSFADEDRRDMAQLIARQADDASWLIEDLLVVYRDDVSRVPVVPEDFDVVKSSERVLEVIDYPIDIEVRGEDALVHADPRRTRQILRNLVSNALRYGGENVVMRIEPVDNRVEVKVCDDGAMIDSAEVDRIFKPFEAARSGRPATSVGLGLPVARKLAWLMEGDLTYRFADGMSCFVLSLPAT